MWDLVYEAAAADAYLEGCDGVSELAGEGGAPLDVETNYEAVEPAAVDILDVGNPVRYFDGVVSDGGEDGVVKEGDVVGAVAIR